MRFFNSRDRSAWIIERWCFQRSALAKAASVLVSETLAKSFSIKSAKALGFASSAVFKESIAALDLLESG